MDWMLVLKIALTLYLLFLLAMTVLVAQDESYDTSSLLKACVTNFCGVIAFHVVLAVPALMFYAIWKFI